MRDVFREGLGSAWAEAVEQARRGFDWLRTLPTDLSPRSPRWWTPLALVQVYGVSVLGGDAGAGKSMFAMSVALQSALRDDVATVYVAAEMTREQILYRFAWLATAWGHTQAGFETALASGRLVILSRQGPLTFDDFSEAVGAALLGEESALVVIDSINSLLDTLESPDEGYWSLYRRVRNAIVDARRITEGRLAFLLISELNKDSVTKGRQWEYAADLVVTFRQTATPRTVAAKVVKSREKGVEGSLGDWRMTDSGTYERSGGFDA